MVNNTIQFAQYYLKLPSDPTHLNNGHESFVTQNDDTGINNSTRFYVPIAITEETITTLNNWEWGEWFPVITHNNKTIHYLGIYGSTTPDIIIRFTKNNLDLPAIIQSLKSNSITPITHASTTNDSETDIKPHPIAIGRAYQHTNQNIKNRFGYNRRSCGTDIIHPKRTTSMKTPNFVFKITLDEELIRVKPNLTAIWNRTNNTHADINTNIYLRKRVNVQHVYYIIYDEPNPEKGIKITIGNETFCFARIHPISTRFNFMCKIFYNLQEHDWAQLISGTNNISILIPLVHEPYHSRLKYLLSE